ncbi:MAG TPA: homocysteine S-methyltransferase [Thermoanaerobaculia bacterium]|jgi:homocysteine S-methyltransferase
MARAVNNPVNAFLRRQQPMILDGGLATEMEARGCDLSDELWSAGYLLLDPDVIRRVHLDYLAAGADCVTAATYQATLRGFRRRGLSLHDARTLLLRAVELAREARDRFWEEAPPGRLRPLVAASVGPYGAYLADGSEYTGAYDRDENALVAFHRRRFALLAASGADLLACETVPSAAEARALLRLLRESPGTWAWLSFSCRDGRHLADGSEIAAIAAEAAAGERVAAVGVNCTAPRFVPELLDEIRRVSERPIVVYPNSGELWDAAAKRWRGRPDPDDFAAAAAVWVERGAALVGGCCRTGPEHVRRIRRRLLG